MLPVFPGPSGLRLSFVRVLDGVVCCRTLPSYTCPLGRTASYPRDGPLPRPCDGTFGFFSSNLSLWKRRVPMRMTQVRRRQLREQEAQAPALDCAGRRCGRIDRHARPHLGRVQRQRRGRDACKKRCCLHHEREESCIVDSRVLRASSTSLGPATLR